jgi:hypothetical protein
MPARGCSNSSLASSRDDSEPARARLPIRRAPEPRRRPHRARPLAPVPVPLQPVIHHPALLRRALLPVAQRASEGRGAGARCETGPEAAEALLWRVARHLEGGLVEVGRRRVVVAPSSTAAAVVARSVVTWRVVWTGRLRSDFVDEPSDRSDQCSPEPEWRTCTT